MNDKRTIKQPWLTLIRLFWLALISFNLLPMLLGLPDYYRELLALIRGRITRAGRRLSSVRLLLGRVSLRRLSPG